MTSRTRSYSELEQLKTFEDRFTYLKMNGEVGRPTFGYDRYLNQKFYKSFEWKQIRNFVIVRDKGCDLGIDGYEIHGELLIHHMNPISPQDIQNGSRIVFDPEFLICTTSRTHLAIHFGDASLLPQLPVIRFPGDTIPWRK